MRKRILIVGLGSMGRRHLSIVKQLLPEAEIQILRRENTTNTSGFGVAKFKSLYETKQFIPEIFVIYNNT